MVPDYTHMEDTNNLISGNGDEWTANRDGFIIAKIDDTNNGTGYLLNRLDINGKRVTDEHIIGDQSLGRSRFGPFPVSVGDAVKIWTSGESGSTFSNWSSWVYFIPPKAVTPPQLNENYTPNEIDTGKKWVDGETVYRQTFEGNITAVPNQYNSEPLMTSGVADIVAYGGWLRTGNPEKLAVNAYTSFGTTTHSLLHTSGDKLFLQSFSTKDRDGVTNSDYKVWVEYTRAP
jgi:hypothetical protein